MNQRPGVLVIFWPDLHFVCMADTEEAGCGSSCSPRAVYVIGVYQAYKG
jgi:hypothetical protein